MTKEQFAFNAKMRGANDVVVLFKDNVWVATGRFNLCKLRFKLTESSLELLYYKFMRTADKHEPLPNSRSYGRESLRGDQAW